MAAPVKTQKGRSIIFIHKDRFEYYDEAQSKIFQFQFQPNVISDLEIINEDELNLEIKSFVQSNKLAPSNIFFVISDSIIFEKSFSNGSDKNTKIQNYLENIPFEHVSFKVVDTAKEYIVMAMNTELYTRLKNSFETLAFTALNIIPQSALGDSYRSRQSLDSDIIKYILNHIDSLQKQGFIQDELGKPAEDSPADNSYTTVLTEGQKTNKYRLPVLIGLFAILIGVLLIVVYLQFFQKPKKPSPVPSTIVAPTKTTSP